MYALTVQAALSTAHIVLIITNLSSCRNSWLDSFHSIVFESPVLSCSPCIKEFDRIALTTIQLGACSLIRGGIHASPVGGKALNQDRPCMKSSSSLKVAFCNCLPLRRQCLHQEFRRPNKQPKLPGL